MGIHRLHCNFASEAEPTFEIVTSLKSLVILGVLKLLLYILSRNNIIIIISSYYLAIKCLLCVLVASFVVRSLKAFANRIFITRL